MGSNRTPRVTWLAAPLSSVPNDDIWIDPLMAKRLAAMRFTKRRSETMLARWVAKRAIAATVGIAGDTHTLTDVVVRNAPDGAPEAFIGGDPINGVIAMTDRADVAVAMMIVATRRIGCDLELVEPRSDAFVDDYFTETEKAAVVAAANHDVTANLIWSAKESALKVLRTGLRRDTRTVSVSFDEGATEGWRPLEVTVDGVRRLPGWWLRSDSFLLTCVTEVPTDPPESLEDPHGLARAVPSHTWLHSPRVAIQPDG